MTLKNPRPFRGDPSSTPLLAPLSPIRRRDFCAASISIASVGAFLPSISAYADMPVLGIDATSQPSGDPSIHPFKFRASDAALADLRQRLGATRWPSRELVADASQGVQLATTRELARYWQSDYDWRRFEARLNALPQFMTTIDGVDIHFIHIRSKHPNALAVIVTHGWPGSIIEQLKIIDPLTNPTAHGGGASDAFDLVIPSLPGHGFSGTPKALGWDPVRVARAWVALMKRLGYTRYVAQGGDRGNAVTEQMALLASPELIGIHTNMPATIPDDIAESLRAGGPPPPGLSTDEQRPHTRCRERLSGRDLYGSAQLDGECLPATGSLQSPRQGRTLRGMGAAGGVYGRTSFELQVLAMRRSF